MKGNLSSGKFRFVVLMDKLHDRLKDLVMFLNANTRFDIYAVEVEYYKFDKYEIVIPKLFGSEVKKEVAVSSAGSARKVWNEQSFFEDAKESLPEEALKAVQKLYTFSKREATDISWGKGAHTGSFNPKFAPTGHRSAFSVYSKGDLQLNLDFIDEGGEGQAFRKKWVEVLGRQLDFQVADNDKFPIIGSDVWVPKVDKFIATFEELLQTRM